MKYKHYRCTPKYSEIEKLYYGTVEGVPEIPMIESKDIYDFEYLFHQAVDDYLDRRRSAKLRTRWGLIIAILVIIGLLVAMVLTCPKKEQHVNVLTEKFSYLLTESSGTDKDANILGAMIGGAIAKQVINAYLIVDDNVLFSVGRLEYKGENRVVSVGALGHIFTISNNELKHRVEQDKDTQELLK